MSHAVASVTPVNSQPPDPPTAMLPLIEPTILLGGAAVIFFLGYIAGVGNRRRSQAALLHRLRRDGTFTLPIKPEPPRL
jgi:hypothetical protein